MREPLRRLWDAPCAAPEPPVRVWRDWVLLAAAITGALAEGLLAADVPWRPVALVLTVGLAFTLLWRRTHPLAMVAIAFGSAIALDLATFAAGLDAPVGLASTAFVVVLVYALYRWGSGPQIGIGTIFVLVAFCLGISRDFSGWAEAAAAFLFITFPAVLGVSVRLAQTSRLRELDQVRLREREQLARELHDTVAHHVSAMVIRAQAGRVVAPSDPAAADEALAVIEAEGSRTLAEMRALVGALRADDDPELAPQRGVADIERLAQTLGDEPPVDVELSGDLDDLGPGVEAALYRIAQESITNAKRHARRATRIVVRVEGDRDRVRFTAVDDGDVVSPAWVSAGYGVVGMTERATLLGGTIEVGPGRDRGWVVDAVLPRVGAAR